MAYLHTGTDTFQAASTANSFFELSALNEKGALQSFADFKNAKAIVVVNVACKCGLTSDHYKELVELYKLHKDAGLEILAFPCNQFAGQEPWELGEILSYTKDTFGVEFPIFQKVDVNGENPHEVYKYLRAKSSLSEGGSVAKKIPWNFGKFVVNPKTEEVTFFHPNKTPNEMLPTLQPLLQ